MGEKDRGGRERGVGERDGGGELGCRERDRERYRKREEWERLRERERKREREGGGERGRGKRKEKVIEQRINREKKGKRT